MHDPKGEEGLPLAVGREITPPTRAAHLHRPWRLGQWVNGQETHAWSCIGGIRRRRAVTIGALPPSMVPSVAAAWPAPWASVLSSYELHRPWRPGQWPRDACMILHRRDPPPSGRHNWSAASSHGAVGGRRLACAVGFRVRDLFQEWGGTCQTGSCWTSARQRGTSCPHCACNPWRATAIWLSHGGHSWGTGGGRTLLKLVMSTLGFGAYWTDEYWY
jgi:hypothetical protein